MCFKQIIRTKVVLFMKKNLTVIFMDSDQQLSQQFKKNQTFYFHMDCLNFYTGICAQLSG